MYILQFNVHLFFTLLFTQDSKTNSYLSKASVAGDVCAGLCNSQQIRSVMRARRRYRRYNHWITSPHRHRSITRTSRFQEIRVTDNYRYFRGMFSVVTPSFSYHREICEGNFFVTEEKFIKIEMVLIFAE